MRRSNSSYVGSRLILNPLIAVKKKSFHLDVSGAARLSVFWQDASCHIRRTFVWFVVHYGSVLRNYPGFHPKSIQPAK